MIFKKLFFYILLLTIFSCDNKKVQIEEIQTRETKEVLNNENSNTEFKLSEKNIMEFLLEYDKHNKENKVRIFTDYGNIDIELFYNTKFHRSNFIFLTKQNYFDDTQFYRVINNFVIQAGNSDSRKITNKRKKIGRYLLPNDLNKGYTHKRGMISMPSSLVNNPYKMASPFEFFIVQSKEGAHHLDGNYTVLEKLSLEWKQSIK